MDMVETQDMEFILEHSETTKKIALNMWRDNRKRPFTTLDECLKMMKTIRSLKDTKHQDAADNYEVALRIMDMLMERILLVGDDESLKSACSYY